ncbi:elongin-B isoform X2 [Exaiptasia diaphana]|uniref:Elongin-B n=1 Tax=Exaiptasia diaphana TaxID=2652724 RepID=A0A913Y444_EXADI|nr:elongin-B isoform X2 [Exaiptasia diaphana]KXJ29095.1 Transcription elongation factor B polypeptide 2 [Exaiptasia diaphana]
MEVFLMVRRTKTSMFLDCKEGTTVVDVKKMIEGIIKRPPEDQRLFKDEQILDDNKTLGDCGFTNQTSKAQTPAVLGLALRQDDGEFEQLAIDPLSSPPELPDVMKPQESASNSEGS